MSGVFGWIMNTTANGYADIICRNPEIDALLISAGHDPATVNQIESPLVGAANWLNAKLLLRPGNELAIQWTGGAANGNDPIDPWELYLVEPLGTSAGSDVVSEANPEFLPNTEIKIVRNVGITLPAERETNIPEGLASQSNAEVAQTSETFGSASVPSAQENRKATEFGPAQLPVGRNIQTQATTLQHLPSPGRSMVYKGLILKRVIELRRPASALPAVNESGRPRSGERGLFLVEFVDARWMLNGLRSSAYMLDKVEDGILSNGKITDAAGSNYVGGMARACFNMLADPPVSFEAHTVKKTVSYPPAMLDFPGFANAAADTDRAPSWNHFMKNNRTRRHWTNTVAAPTHIQQPYSRDELIANFAAQVSMATLAYNLRLDLDFYDRQINGGEAAFDDGDIINLDFRGMTLGEAMDTFAQRLGCVWLYDRGAPSLILSLARRSNTGQNDRVPFESVPHLGEWLATMENHRVAGYINTMTVDLPQTVLLTHEAHYCSRFGPEASGQRQIDWFGVYTSGSANLSHTFAHLVDCRSHTTSDGVLSTRFTTGLSSDASAMWHTSRSFPVHISVELRDHIPAMVGHNSPVGYVPVWLPGTNHYSQTGGTFSFFPEFYFAAGGATKGIGNTNLKIDKGVIPDATVVDYETPWNYSSGLLRTAYKSLDTATITDTPIQSSDVFDPTSAARFDTSLKRRRELLEFRINELRFVADGDATFNRMPLGIMRGVYRQITPSVGLQYECVRFGAPDIQNIFYRIWGSNTNPILYPAGAKVQTMTAGAGSSAVLRSGVRHLTVRRAHTGNVLRVFMARVIAKQSIPAIPENDPQDSEPFYITKYFFVEATPDANPFNMYWSSAGALGYKGMTSGVAFNLYEQWFHPVDDGVVQIRPTSVGGTVFQQSFGDNEDRDIILPKIPAVNIVPVYEVANRLGFSSYWIAVQPDLEKRCAPNPIGGFAAPTPPTWPYMGASGAATSTSGDLADIIENA
jgi:hypothetical protein